MRRSKGNNHSASRPRKHGRDRHDNERRNKRAFAQRSSEPRVEERQTLSQLEAVESLLSGIGVPDQRPFAPDAFQLEALAAIEHEDALVTAPTGSGKTWIAREEIRDR